MPKEFINPNLHVILIHYPLGLLTIGLLIEVFSFIGWRRSSFRMAGRWMLLLGILSLPPVMFLGLYALTDVNRHSETPLDATWIESRLQSPIQGEAWEFMTRHAWSNAAGSTLLLILMVLWMGSSDAWRRKLHLLYVLGLLAGFAALVFGAWHGGEMVYRHGVGVEVVRERADTQDVEGSGSGSPAIIEQTTIKDLTAYYAPPLQVHMILAGGTVSLALAALGVSLRAGATRDAAPSTSRFGVAPEQTEIASALNPSFARPATPHGYDADVDPPPPPIEIAERRRFGGARFWLIAAVLAIGASLSGFWTLAYFSDIWEIEPGERLAHMWGQITDRDLNDGAMITRRFVHTIVGGAIIVLLLLLSIIARVAAGRRFVLVLFSILLIVALAAQVWFGSLLMFDTPSGPLGSFNGSAAALEAVTDTDERERATAPDAAGEPAVTSPPATAPAPTPTPTSDATSPAAPATTPSAVK